MAAAAHESCSLNAPRGLDRCRAGLYGMETMTDPESAAGAARRRRLLFRATHRGTFENDLMIGGFVRDNLAALTDSDLDALEALLETPDVDLADWLTGRCPIPPEAATPMLLRIRASLRS
jgi:antitoxin CptB